jgi:hypothetical protein
MGLLPHFLTIRRKTEKRPKITRPSQIEPKAEDDHEAVMNRLLRSSSARYTVKAETDYKKLPPIRKCMCDYIIISHPQLAHPINEVLNATTPKNRRGTFSVKVRKVETHSTLASRTAVYAPSDVPPDVRDISQLHCLRSEPSVATLLDMYDEQGHLPPDMFSNSPQSRPMIKSSTPSATLRQLLGNNGDAEDVAWADEYLK